MFKHEATPPRVLAQAALFLTAQSQLASAGPGAPWTTLTNRRFSDISERTYTFDEQAVIVRAGRSGYHVSTGDLDTAATFTLISPTEMITQFPDIPALSTIIPVGQKLHIFHSGKQYILTQPMIAEEEGSAAQKVDNLTSPMPATVIEVKVAVGDEVKSGQVVCVLESMKMEINIRAGRDGKIGGVNVGKGQVVEEGSVLVALEPVTE